MSLIMIMSSSSSLSLSLIRYELDYGFEVQFHYLCVRVCVSFWV